MIDWTVLPPLATLRAFAALAEHGSVARAGQALNVTHAAISQQVRALESHLGLALVDRSRRALSLTPEGRRLADSLSTGLGLVAQEIAALTGADRARPLQVSTTPLFAANWLMARLWSFRAEHPAIELMINPTPETVTLGPGGIDLAIRFGAGDWPRVEAELLIETRFLVVAAPKLVEGRRIDGAADLLDLPWLQELGTTEARDWLRRRGVNAARTGPTLHLPGSLILEGVRRGEGVAATAEAFVADDIAAGRLRVLFAEHAPGTGYYLVSRPGVLRPAAQAFAQWIRRAARAG